MFDFKSCNVFVVVLRCERALFILKNLDGNIIAIKNLVRADILTIAKEPVAS